MTPDRRRRVAFVLGEHSSGMWLGGMNYHRNLLSALSRHGSGAIEPLVLVGRGYEQDVLDDLGPVEIRRSPYFERRRPERILRAAAERGVGRDAPLERLLRRLGVELVSHYRPLGRASRFPTIGWIADFQHRRLPDFVDDKEHASRERFLGYLCEHSTTLVVSSEAARRDLADFSRTGFEKSRVLRFVVEPPAESGPPIGELRARYGFERRYLFLPNQFWAHKNHRVVVDALRILGARGRSLSVVATGDTNDYRNPGFFHQLMRQVRDAGVEKDFRVLGRIPYAEMIVLMRNSVAVVNPSLFEGWSTTVEEAKSLGKRLVLSNIPVHREQDPPGGAYFDPADAESLADALWAVWTLADPEADRRLLDQARRALPARRRGFAHAYEEIVRETLEGAAGVPAAVRDQ